MTDHSTQRIDARDLHTRLSTLQTLHGPPSPHSNMSYRRPRTSSLDSSTSLSYMPRFSKSSTISTTASADSSTSRYSAMRAEPISATHRDAVEIPPGEFSKPRINQRSRRGTQSSSRRRSEDSSAGNGGKEFQYYGRHSNQWLFNDFSVTDAVSRGFKRVFGKEQGSGDWYENRGREKGFRD